MTDSSKAPKVAQIPNRSAGIGTADRSTPHGCGRCDARWGGANTSHCSACHRTFTGLTAFDAHRDGSHANSTRHCVDPETVGLVPASRSYDCWGYPGGDNPWGRK